MSIRSPNSNERDIIIAFYNPFETYEVSSFEYPKPLSPHLWDCDMPLSLLPFHIAKKFRDEAQFLYDDLDYQRLKVITTPAPEPSFDGHKIRVAVDHNPSWYSSMYNADVINPSKFRNRKRQKPFVRGIKREDVFNSLERILRGKDGIYDKRNHRYAYDMSLRSLIYEKLVEGRDYEGEECYVDEIISIAFDKENDYYFDPNGNKCYWDIPF